MIVNYPNTNERVCLALPASGTDYDEAASVLTQVIRDLGPETFTARDGAPSILEADTLILFGKCSDFTASVQRLSAHPGRRPKTIVWHIEPLPPKTLPNQALHTARLLARCDWNQMPRPLAALMQWVPGRNWARDAARSVLSRRLGTLAGWRDTPAETVHSREIYHAVQHYLWLRQWHSRQWCDVVAASTPARCAVLDEMGIPCRYAPLGYHPAWGQDLGRERDIDVVFLGSVRRTARRDLLGSLSRQLEHKGTTLAIVDRQCYGRDRAELFSRARIVLDLVKNTWEMPIMRLLIAMPCGPLVVSNWRGNPFPFRDEHMVRVDTAALPETIAYYLQHESQRRRIAQAGRRHVIDKLAWTSVVSDLLQRARQHFETPCGGVI